MDKRYQVFISSTYEDLKEARAEVIQALLELDCIPAGMELFPAANDDQWTLIKNVIDDCDYYMVIVAGRYGSVGADGVSYTQMEYEYAVEKGKPVIGFIHKAPDSLPAKHSEKTEGGREKLEAFRGLVQQRMCKFWSEPADLGSAVSRSLIKLIKTNPATGWVRADLLPEQSATEEILKLRKRIEELDTELSQSRTAAPQGTEDLSQGDDEIDVGYSVDVYRFRKYSTEATFTGKASLTWNEMFYAMSPLMIDEATDSEIKSALASSVRFKMEPILRNRKEAAGMKFNDFKLDDSDFNTIKVQFMALGLMIKSRKNRSVKDKSTYWTLTPYGESVMTRLRAIRRKDADTEA
ncbi:MAG: DUF4062 domain-containing protein [Bacteroidota bacterium]